MPSGTSQKQRYVIGRKQKLDASRRTPVFVDEKFPTAPISISNFGHGTSTQGVGSAWLMGSRYIKGSPDDITYNMTYTNFTSNTPSIYFALTHSRGTPRAFGGPFPGTLKVWYQVAKGQMESFGNVDEPIASVPPGSIRLYCLGAGSSKSSGKGSPPTIQGLGSKASLVVSAELRMYPI